MGSTNKTTNVQLSQFVDADKPTWLGDYNGDMLKIESALNAGTVASNAATSSANAASVVASSATTAANAATATANSASTLADTATTAADNATTTANAANTLASSAATMVTNASNIINAIAPQGMSSYLTIARGVTSARPAVTVGTLAAVAMWYDNTLNKPIWSDGTNWRDATGAIV